MIMMITMTVMFACTETVRLIEFDGASDFASAAETTSLFSGVCVTS